MLKGTKETLPTISYNQKQDQLTLLNIKDRSRLRGQQMDSDVMVYWNRRRLVGAVIAHAESYLQEFMEKHQITSLSEMGQALTEAGNKMNPSQSLRGATRWFLHDLLGETGFAKYSASQS